MNDKALFRLSGLALMVGAVIGAVLNAIHPRDLDFDNFTESTLDAVAASSLWSEIHIGLVFAAALVVVGLMGLYRSIGGEAGAALARLGLGAAIVGGAVLVVTIAIDGVGMKHVADIWSSAGADETLVLPAAEALLAATSGLLSVSLLVFFGLGFGLFFLAIAFGEGYPKWLGWLGLIGSFASMWGGSLYFYDARLTQTSLSIFVASSLYLTVVALVLGALLFRKGLGATAEATQPALIG
jgi:hypothetical protein